MARQDVQEFNNDGNSPLRVPGMGLPISYEHKPPTTNHDPLQQEHSKRFRHGTGDYVAYRRTAKELTILEFINAVTDKPDWNIKIHQDHITEKWRAEAQRQDPLMSQEVFDWCMLELGDKAARFERDGFVNVLDTESVCVKSDTLISTDLQQDLKDALRPLLSSPLKDWHPKSNNQVLNLVHPSLFPAVYGRSLVLEEGLVGLDDCMGTVGHGQLLPTVAKADGGGGHDHNWRWSLKYQWLPCEVKFQGDHGTNVTIASYINNLHPVRHRQLYPVIAKLISASIRPWNEVLIQGDWGRTPSRIRTYGPSYEPELPDWVEKRTEMSEAAYNAKVMEYLALPEPSNNAESADSGDDDDDDDDEDEDDDEDDDDDDDDRGPRADWSGKLSEWPAWAVINWKHSRLRTLIHPEPGKSFSYEDWKEGKTDKPLVPPSSGGHSAEHASRTYQINIEQEFRELGLQVIVKIGGIELTPETPQYRGGDWHLEGMLNEHIVATAIYYYDVENITSSEIRFRQEAELDEIDLVYEQSEHAPICTVFGTGTEDLYDEPAIQEIGGIKTLDGRFVAFGNTMQHRVEPFQLQDASRPGHRRFVVLWLVDPYYRILSTANVPPQQHDWWADEVMRTAGLTLPMEVRKMVTDHADDWPMGREEAEKIRLDLMSERTVFAADSAHHVQSYNLCEH